MATGTLRALITAGLGISVMIAGAAAPVAAASPDDPLTVGSILYGVDGYQVAHGKAMETYGESIGDTIRTCNSNNSVAGQQKCVEDMIAAGVDGIVLQPMELAAGATFVKSIQEANIPVVTWAIGPVPDVTVPFADLAEREQATEAGRAAAEWVKTNLNATPKLVVLDVPNNTNCANREDGFIAGAMAADPDTEVVARPDGGGVRLKSQNAMADVIQSGKEFNIVTGCNGESTLGGLAALRAVGRGMAVDKVPVSEYLFSIDGTEAEVIELIDPNSPLMSTLALTPKDNTKKLLDYLHTYVAGEVPDDDQSLHLTDVFLTPDCEATNEVLSDQYGTTVACP